MHVMYQIIKRMAGMVCLSATLVTAVSCAKTRVNDSPQPEMSPVLISKGAQSECYGRLRFPREDAEFEQEVAVVRADLEDAEGSAKSRARARLLERVCGDRGPDACARINAYIRPWKTLKVEPEVCAFMLLDSRDLATALDQPQQELKDAQRAMHTGLDGVAVEIASKLGAAAPLRFDAVELECVRGGYLADWLHDHMAVKLGRQGLVVEHGPQSEAPLLTVKVRSVESSTSSSLSGFEVIWTLRQGSQEASFGPTYIDQQVAPKQPPPTRACTELDRKGTSQTELAWVGAVRAGALCEYQTARLMARSNQSGHLRVIASTPSYPHGVVIVPAKPEIDATIDGGGLVDLIGQDSFIFPMNEQHTLETHTIAVAATPESFGPALEHVDRMCKLRPAQLEAIQAGTAWDEAKVSASQIHTSIISGPACAVYDTPRHRAAGEKARALVDALPFCDSLSEDDKGSNP